MKTTEHFKEVIKQHLEQRAAGDELFAVSFSKENKSIEECINYILNTVQKSGCNGFTDAEIFGMAVHYYDEDDLKGGAVLTPNVVINRTIELTPEEKEQARKAAIERATDEAYKALIQKPKANKTESINQPSLF